jgi:serine/threonine-protein kinase PpkA
MNPRRPLSFPLHLKQRAPHRIGATVRGLRAAIAVPRFKGYRVQKKIGEGRTSIVYLARDMERRTSVAIKVLRPEPAADPGRAEAFLREFAVPAVVHHPHVMRVCDRFLADGCPAVAMEFVGGGDLGQRIRKGLQPGAALALLRQAASALDALHREGFAHGDVKPANLLLRATGELVLADFGGARHIDAPVPRAITGLVVGTPRYAAPEQSRDGVAGTAADIYSLGVILHEMLCGKAPFPGNTVMEVFCQHLMAPIPRLPQDLVRFQPLLDAMLDKQPHTRLQDGGAVLQQIDLIQDATPAHPVPFSAVRK